MDKKLTIVEHLEELRHRIIICVISVILISMSAFPFVPQALAILKSSASGTIEKLVFFNPADAILIHIRIAFFIGLALSTPIILYQLWAFVSPAVGHETKKHAFLFLLFSLGAFVSGAFFGFFILLVPALKFLLGFSGSILQPVISASSYISFVLGLTLGCAIIFEMPVLTFLLSRVGIINYRILRKGWKYAVIAIFIIAAVITPTPDVFNMTILAIPMLILYEVSVWISKFSGRKGEGIDLRG